MTLLIDDKTTNDAQITIDLIVIRNTNGETVSTSNARTNEDTTGATNTATTPTPATSISDNSETETNSTISGNNNNASVRTTRITGDVAATSTDSIASPRTTLDHYATVATLVANSTQKSSTSKSVSTTIKVAPDVTEAAESTTTDLTTPDNTVKLATTSLTADNAELTPTTAAAAVVAEDESKPTVLAPPEASTLLIDKLHTKHTSPSKTITACVADSTQLLRTDITHH